MVLEQLTKWRNKMKDDTGKDVLALLGIPVFLVLILIAFIPLGLFNAWAVQKMYIWFLLPLGLPALNLLHIWGISLLVSHYTVNMDGRKKKKGETWSALFASLIATLLMLAIGFVIKSHI